MLWFAGELVVGILGFLVVAAQTGLKGDDSSSGPKAQCTEHRTPPRCAGETVGVLVKGGAYRCLPWLGFIERDCALRVSKPVKLRISRVVLEGDFSTT